MIAYRNLSLFGPASGSANAGPGYIPISVLHLNEEERGLGKVRAEPSGMGADRVHPAEADAEEAQHPRSYPGNADA